MPPARRLMHGLRPNRFKAALASSLPQIGLWACACSPLATEAVAHSGIDWLCIDMEHAPNGVGSVLHQLHAVQASTAQPVVRVPGELDVALVKRLLDIGVQSLLFPMVESAEQAAATVASTRYPPHGVRGVMSTMRATAYATDAEELREYYTSATDELAVVVQVESISAARDAVAIGRVKGIDGVFIGPADLAASMGHMGRPDHPEVQHEIRRTIHACVSAGVPVGIFTNEAAVPDFLQAGASFIAVGTEIGLLASSSRAIAHRFRGTVSSIRMTPTM